MVKSIVWVESHLCNNVCPYCAIYKLDKTKRGTWQEWVEKLNALNPEIIDITGGEPFLNPNMVDIINGLNCKVGITTNATKDLTRYVQEVSPNKVVSMTLSFHPSQNTISKEYFIGKCLMLRQRGFNVTVNFVAYPEQMYLIQGLRQIFESGGIRFHIDPYAEEAEHPYKLNDKEKDFLRPFITEDRLFKVDRPQETTKLCSGGMDYLNIHPNGSVYRCMTLALMNDKPMGNLFDPNFKVNTEFEFCNKFGLCGGCDRDKATFKDPLIKTL